jgi:hypothetical protein
MPIWCVLSVVTVASAHSVSTYYPAPWADGYKPYYLSSDNTWSDQWIDAIESADAAWDTISSVDFFVFQYWSGNHTWVSCASTNVSVVERQLLDPSIAARTTSCPGETNEHFGLLINK